jgi:DNA-binding MarR family transcriptional regulator
LKLTVTQLQALRYLHGYQSLNGFPATRRELCGHMGWSAPSTAQGIIERLERAGVLERVDARNGVLRVTLLGRSVLNHERTAA